MKRSTDYNFYASFAICVLAAVALVYLAVKYAFGIILPFIVAYLTAFAAVKAAGKFVGKKQRYRGAVAAVFFVLTVSIGGYAVYLIVSRAAYEVEQLLLKLGEDDGQTGRKIYEFFDAINNLGSKIPILGKLKNSERTEEIAKYIENALAQTVKNSISTVSDKFSTAVAKVISSLPSILVSFLVTLTAGFYFCIDFDKVNALLMCLLPEKLRKRVPDMKNGLLSGGAKYIKAYLCILFITFIELYLGFTVIGTGYALLQAALIAVVDLLPVLGVGTVLIPWSIFEFALENTRLGVGLLILYIAVAVIRQMIEPRLVGKSLGLHPIATLVSMYAGLKLFGVAGMILAPPLCTAVIAALKYFGKSENTE